MVTRGDGWRREALIGLVLDYPAVALFFLTYQGESLSFSVLLTNKVISFFSYAYQSSIEIGHAFGRRIDRYPLLY